MTNRFKRWIAFVLLTVVTAGSLIGLTKIKPINQERHEGSVAVEELAKEINQLEEKVKEQEETEKEINKPEPEEVLEVITLVNKSALNKRSEPVLGDNIRDVIPQGTELKLYDKIYNDEWYEIANGDGLLDYVNKDYLVSVEEWQEIEAELKKKEQERLAKIEEQKKAQEIKAKENPTSKLSRGGEVPQGKNIKVEVSHYCACSSCSGGYGGKTASGSGVYVGAVAAPPEIPLGSKIMINGNMYTVEDRGGYIQKVGDTYRIDIYVPNHQEALSKGRYTTTAQLY